METNKNSIVYNREKFFATIREKLFPTLSQAQVDRLNAYLDYAENIQMMPEQLAYVLATVYHETGIKKRGRFVRFLPVEEVGKGRGRPYGRKVKYNGERYSGNNIYYGRGDIQLTWWDNYDRAEKLLGIPGLLAHPEKALEPDIAMKIAIEGLRTGLFTGRKLSDYINEKKVNFVQARRTVNVLDKASLIAGYARAFLKALR